MKVQPEFTNEELTAIAKGLQIAAIHETNKNYADKIFELSKKITIVIGFNSQLKK